MRGLGAALLIGLLGAASAQAYTQNRVSSGNPVVTRWNFSGLEPEVLGGSLEFRLHPAGSDDVLDGSDLAALERALQTWADVADTSLSFTRGADYSGEVVANDDIFNTFWVESSTIVDQDTPDPSDDIDIAGSLAITFTWWWTSGPAAGEIIDANVVFNGNEQQWTTDPASEPGRFDIESVAVHEYGHALGFGHSPVGGASMFPRTGAGHPLPRDLSLDDTAAAGASYGTAAWTSNTARLTGIVRDGGAPVFGAHVVVQDADGNVIAGAISLSDGSYDIDGLPAGSLSVWVEPLDRADGSTVMFNEWNLPSIWRGGVIDLDFRTSPDTPVVTTAGMTSVVDFDVPSGSPGLNITMVGPSNNFLSNSPAFVDQGAKDVEIRIAGPSSEVPSSGTPLSVSGTGITPKSTSFQTFNGGTMRAVHLVVDVDPDAEVGLRSFVLDDGAERTVAAGHLEILAVGAPSDADGDTVPDGTDNCPATPNPGQADADGDGAGDACDPCPNDAFDDADGDGLCADADNCPSSFNPTQLDSDGDGAGDVCDACPIDALDDSDGDGLCADVDNCPTVSNPGQQDADGDGAGDACDPCPNDALDDADSDGHCADADNCPSVSNPGQQDADSDGRGDACDSCPNDALDDADSDGLCADVDNCPSVANPGQGDADGDGAGDACDLCPNDPLDDEDGDGHCADVDNCPSVSNPGQQDADSDGSGDVCDVCPSDPLDDEDADGFCANADNCPSVSNQAQDDSDMDGAGDACDACPFDAADDSDGDGLCGDVDNCPLAPNPGQDDADGDGFGDDCDVCPNDPFDRCVTVNLLRNADATERSAAAVQAVFVNGEGGGLHSTDDLAFANIGGTSQLTLTGEAAPVGDGNPGVLTFYDVENMNGLLSVERVGNDLRLSGW